MHNSEASGIFFAASRNRFFNPSANSEVAGATRIGTNVSSKASRLASSSTSSTNLSGSFSLLNRTTHRQSVCCAFAPVVEVTRDGCSRASAFLASLQNVLAQGRVKHHRDDHLFAVIAAYESVSQKFGAVDAQTNNVRRSGNHSAALMPGAIRRVT